jgi:hypothetical protein
MSIEVNGDAVGVACPSERQPQGTRGPDDQVTVVDRQAGIAACQLKGSAPWRYLERVVQRQRLEHGVERVKPVGLDGADAQREVELGVGTDAEGLRTSHGLLPRSARGPD